MVPQSGDSLGPPLEGVHLRLLADGMSSVTTASREEVLRGAERDVLVRLLEILNEVACFVGAELAVHAALLIDAADRGVLICGRSGAGKSTLTANLAVKGLRYATDELVEVEGGGRVRGWRKWLALKGASRQTVPELTPPASDRQLLGDRWLIPPDRLGDAPSGWVHPSLVVLPRFVPDADVSIEEIPRGRALVQVLQQCFDLRDRSQRVLDSLACVVRDAVCVEVTYGDAREASGAVLRHLSQSATADIRPVG